MSKDLDLSKAEARLKEFCDRKGVATVPLLDAEGCLTEVAGTFFKKHGLSLDWVFCGDGPHPTSESGQFLSVLRQLPDEITKNLYKALVKHSRKEIDFDEVLEVFNVEDASI